MAIDQDGYDNIMDPNTMESLPKLSGFGSGNLSGSNLYIPVYNSITQEYQKVSVQDVQPDYSGVKNSLLADAITTQASPALLPNMIINPNIITPIAYNHLFINGVTGYNAASGISGTTTVGCNMGTIVGVLGAYDTWWSCASAGTLTIRCQGNTVRSATANFSNVNRLITQGDTVCDGMGPTGCRPFPDTSTTAQAAVWTQVPAATNETLINQPVSLSFCAKSADANKKLWYAIVTTTGSTVGIDTASSCPITFNASNADPSPRAGATIQASGSVTFSSTHTWQRISLEGVVIPQGSAVWVVFVENTESNGVKSIWLSGVCLVKSQKAVVYKPNLTEDAFKINMYSQKVTGSRSNGTSPQVGCSYLGVWTSTTNFRVHIPVVGRLYGSPSASNSHSVGFRGTISNVGAVEAATGTFRAASAQTTTVMGNGLILDVTTAATTAGFTGWLSMKDTSTYWENNFWYVISRG